MALPNLEEAVAALDMDDEDEEDRDTDDLPGSGSSKLQYLHKTSTAISQCNCGTVSTRTWLPSQLVYLSNVYDGVLWTSPELIRIQHFGQGQRLLLYGSRPRLPILRVRVQIMLASKRGLPPEILYAVICNRKWIDEIFLGYWYELLTRVDRWGVGRLLLLKLVEISPEPLVAQEGTKVLVLQSPGERGSLRKHSQSISAKQQ